MLVKLDCGRPVLNYKESEKLEGTGFGPCEIGYGQPDWGTAEARGVL